MKIFVLIVLFLGIALAAKYPSTLDRCNVGDSECISKVATAVIKTVIEKNGYPEIGIQTLDPLTIQKIDIKQGAESPVNIELNFRNVNLTGISKLEITKVNGFGKDPNGIHEVQFKLPKFELKGNYKISGKVLVLPIQGDGKCSLTLDNPVGLIKFMGKSVEKKGKTHMQIEKFRLTFNTTRLHIYLGNLFNGDKTLGEHTNLFLNENWEDIFNELKANLFDAFGQIIKSIISGFYNKIPYEESFLS